MFMEALAKVNSGTVIKQRNSIVLKHQVKEVCKNRIDMPFRELIEHLSKKLMPYAMNLTGSTFYSDSHNDMPLLEQVEHPVAVNPDQILKQAAVNNHWPIIDLRN